MTPTPTPSAKERVLAFVRAANPATMELKFGCEIYRGDNSVREFYVGECSGKVAIVRSNKFGTWLPFEVDMELSEKWEILGSDMGWQELCVALDSLKKEIEIETYGIIREVDTSHQGYKVINSADFDLSQNLHNQKPSFYESLLPLLP